MLKITSDWICSFMPILQVFFSLARKYWATVKMVANRRQRRVIPQSAFYFLLLDFDEDNLILISTCSKLQLLLHVKAIRMLKRLLHKSYEVFLENIWILKRSQYLRQFDLPDIKWQELYSIASL